MTRRAARIIADAEALLEFAQRHGLRVEAVEASVDGAVRLLTARPLPGVALNDDESWVDLAGETKAAGRA